MKTDRNGDGAEISMRQARAPHFFRDESVSYLDRASASCVDDRFAIGKLINAPRRDGAQNWLETGLFVSSCAPTFLSELIAFVPCVSVGAVLCGCDGAHACMWALLGLGNMRNGNGEDDSLGELPCVIIEVPRYRYSR